MSNDTRRLAVPQNSDSYDAFRIIQSQSLLNEDGIRLDNRNSSEIRGIYLESGTISQAKGSCYCEIGNTKVICSVFGPKDIEQRDEFQMQGKIKCEFKFAPFSCQKRCGHVPELNEREFSDVIVQSLTSSVRLHCYPKSQIDIYIMVLENDGSIMAAAIMAASIALADACIEQYDIITAATLRVYGHDNFLEDPTFKEEYYDKEFTTVDGINDLNHGTVTVALLPTLNQVCGLMTDGHLESDILVEAIQLCTKTAQNLYSIVRACLVSSVKIDSLKINK